MTLKPSTTYTFSYDVAASESAPGRVELGIMNHDVGFDVLERSEHNNENWERGKLTLRLQTMKIHTLYDLLLHGMVGRNMTISKWKQA